MNNADQHACILPVAQIVPATEAEGPGRRFALWFQGCPLRCPGCCNPEMLPFEGGQPLPLAEVLAQVDAAWAASDIEGITLLGGEPLAHAPGAAALARAVQQRGLSVMVFTGYTLEQARDMSEPADRLLLYLLCSAVHGDEVARALRNWNALSGNLLCRLAFPATFAEVPVPEGVDLVTPWLTGVGACIFEAVQQELMQRCLETERQKCEVLDWQQMQRIGQEQERTLGQLLVGLQRVGRPDLTRFLLAALHHLLPVNPQLRWWVNRLSNLGPRLADRVETGRQALALVRQLATLHQWFQDARQELLKRGFAERDGVLVREQNGVEVVVDPREGTVTVQVAGSQEVEVEGELEGWAADQGGMHSQAAQKQLKQQLHGKLEREIEAKKTELQKQLTDKLEGELADLKKELDQIANKVTAEALKKKAAQMGRIKDICEDPQSGSMTIVLEV